jgi:hypothetical protein
LLDSHIHKLSDKFVATFKNHYLVGARPAHQPRRIGFAQAFAKNLHLASDQTFELPSV